MTIKDWLRLVLPDFEMFFADSTCWTGPVIWNVFEWSARRDAVFRVTLCRVIDIAANDANVLFHNKCLLKSVCRWQVLCQDYVASLSSSHSLWDRITSLRSVFLCPTTGYLTPKQKHVLQSQDFFFRTVLSLTRASSRRSSTIRKKHSTFVKCFCFGVIRTGFEPVTHSLEGCCSIQLSYRTIPFEGAKILFLS